MNLTKIIARHPNTQEVVAILHADPEELQKLIKKLDGSNSTRLVQVFVLLDLDLQTESPLVVGVPANSNLGDDTISSLPVHDGYQSHTTRSSLPHDNVHPSHTDDAKDEDLWNMGNFDESLFPLCETPQTFPTLEDTFIPITEGGNSVVTVNDLPDCNSLSHDSQESHTSFIDLLLQDVTATKSLAETLTRLDELPRSSPCTIGSFVPTRMTIPDCHNFSHDPQEEDAYFTGTPLQSFSKDAATTIFPNPKIHVLFGQKYGSKGHGNDEYTATAYYRSRIKELKQYIQQNACSIKDKHTLVTNLYQELESKKYTCMENNTIVDKANVLEKMKQALRNKGAPKRRPEQKNDPKRKVTRRKVEKK